jgi:hypothetical protein
MRLKKSRLVRGVVLLITLISGTSIVFAGAESSTFELQPKSQTVSLGEPVFVTLEIANNTHHDLGLDLGKNYRGSLTFTIHHPDGSSTQAAGQSEGIYVPGKINIKQGGKYSDRLLLNDYDSFGGTGTYRVEVTLNKAVMVATADTFVNNAEAEVTVAARSPKRLVETCNELLKMVLSNSAGALGAAAALSHIHDSVCFPQLSEALHKAVGFRRAAIVGLASMNDSRILGEFIQAWDSLLWDEQAAVIAEFEKQGRRQELDMALAAAKKKVKPAFYDH